MRVKELTYLFAVIGIALLNAIVSKSVSAVEVLAVNAIILGIIWLLEDKAFGHRSGSRDMYYDQLDLLYPGMKKELYEDNSKRTS